MPPMAISVSGSVTPLHAGNARRVGAGAEQGRMAERRDAAIAGDQIERQNQKRHAR